MWNAHTGVPYFCKKKKKIRNGLRKPFTSNQNYFQGGTLHGRENSVWSVSSFGVDQGTFSLFILYLLSVISFKIFSNVKSNKTKMCVFLKYFSGKTLEKALSSLSLSLSKNMERLFTNGLVTHGLLHLECLFHSF